MKKEEFKEKTNGLLFVEEKYRKSVMIAIDYLHKNSCLSKNTINSWVIKESIQESLKNYEQRINEVIDKIIPLDEECADNMILNNQLKKELG